MPEGGCHGEQEWITGHVTDVCPVMWVNEWSAVFSAYLWAEKGVLPFKGGWAEQPAALMQCIDIVTNAHNTVMKERMENAK